MKKMRPLLLLSTIFSLITAGCGGETTLPNTSSQTTDTGKYTEIITSLDNINLKLDELEKKITTTKGTTSPTTTPSVKPTTGTGTSTTTPETKPTTAPTAEDPKIKGRKILNKLMDKINAAKAYEVVVDKYEKVFATGETVTSGIHLWAKSPNLVKIELTSHSTKASSVGTKLLYTSNSGKVKVRPSGVLSIVTTELAMNDSRIVSPNGYTPDATDIFGLVQRMGKPAYEAELIGKTTINGVEMYILKISQPGKNELDERIKYEQIGFDPNTFAVKLWETFDGKSNTPFMRYFLKTFNLMDSIPDKTMTI